MPAASRRSGAHFENTLVLRCFNNQQQNAATLAASLFVRTGLGVVLVDDGTGDASVVDGLRADASDRVHVLRVPTDVPNGEALRQGMLWALAHGARHVGFADSEFATPPNEIMRLLDALEHQKLAVVLGSRIARVGAHIQHGTVRHGMARVFAALASIALRVTVYDTQCDAKWFRVNPALDAALAEPFTTGWAFDVELLGRLMGRWGAGPRVEDDDILEIPVRAWREGGRTRTSLRDVLGGLWSLIVLSARSRSLGTEHTERTTLVPAIRPPAPRESWAPVEVGPPSVATPLPERSLAAVGKHLGGSAASTRAKLGA